MGFLGSVLSVVAPGLKETFEAGARALQGGNPIPEFNPLPGPLASLLPDKIHAAYDEVVTGINDEAHGLFQDAQGIRDRLHSGVDKLVHGDASGGFHDIFDAHVRGASAAFGFTAVNLAHKASAIQTLLGIEPPARSLTPHERELLEKVFGNTIDYSKVRIKEGNDTGIFGLNDADRPFTPGNTIYMKMSPPPEILPTDDCETTKAKQALQDAWDERLVHETTHVWQFQNFGASYIANSLAHQANPFLYEGVKPTAKDAGVTAETKDEYNWLIAADQGKSWSDLNPEQQARLIQGAFKLGFYDDPNARFVDDQLRDRTAYIRAGMAAARAGIG